MLSNIRSSHHLRTRDDERPFARKPKASFGPVPPLQAQSQYCTQSQCICVLSSAHPCVSPQTDDRGHPCADPHVSALPVPLRVRVRVRALSRRKPRQSLPSPQWDRLRGSPSRACVSGNTNTMGTALAAEIVEVEVEGTGTTSTGTSANSTRIGKSKVQEQTHAQARTSGRDAAADREVCEFCECEEYRHARHGRNRRHREFRDRCGFVGTHARPL